MWLGAVGVGLFGIYQSVMETISTFTEMGISQSSVRDISSAKSPAVLAAIVRRVRKWSWIAAILSATVMCAFAVPLGYWFFDSVHGCWGFILVAVAMFLNALGNGEKAILQGRSRLQQLAKANLYGTLGGLAVSIPLFYWCGYWSVPLSMIAYFGVAYIALTVGRLKVPKMPAEQRIDGRMPTFVKLGLYMASAAFLTSLAHTVFLGILNTIASTSEVGLVQAGDTLIVRYLGLLFTAIGMEFYPRVAANHRYSHRLQVFVNHEIVLMLICLMPLLCLFMLLRRPVISILYTHEFLSIIPFVSWAAVSSIPKAVSWCMGYIILAKGEGRVYIITEGLDAVISVPLCLAAYYWNGLTGLGVAYILWYIIYAVITGFVYYRRYGLRLNRSTLLLIGLAFMITIGYLLGMDYLPVWVMIAVAIPICLISFLNLRRFILHK